MNEWNVTTEHPRNSSSLLTHTMDIHKPNIPSIMGENDFMPLPGERFYTIDAFYAMPEGERAELINGQPYRTAAQYYKG